MRNKEAFFLNPQNNLSKLGLMTKKKSLFIHTYQLQQEDILFLGSDGKDDIELPNGNMNENEFFFLDILNQSNYTLNDIYKLIQLKGNIKDDLSLLKIKVLEKPSIENQKLMIRKKEILNLMAKNHLSIEVYEKIFQELKYYINLVPLDNKMLSLYAQIAFKLNQFDEVIETIERLLMREPQNPSFLLIANKFYNKLIINFSVLFFCIFRFLFFLLMG